jgi:ABC-type antimicrobial peptide transport system permease subunit
VIGIAKDSKYDQLNESPQPCVCFPIRQEQFVKRVDLIVRTALAPESIRGTVLAVIQQMDANLPPPRILTIDELKENATEQASGGGAAAALVAVFGLLALIIATVGVYGVMAYSVSQRTHEFGIRMAVGACRSEILLRVLREGLILTAAGLLVGLAIAVAVAQLLAGLLLDVSPLDPVSLAGSTLLLVAVAMLASYLPARWASHIDPAQSLHTE